MKKSLIILLFLSILIGLNSCVSDGASPKSDDTIGSNDTDSSSTDNTNSTDTNQNPDTGLKPDETTDTDTNIGTDIIPNPNDEEVVQPDEIVDTNPNPDPDIVIPAEKFPDGTTDAEKSFLETLLPAAAYFEVGTPNSKRTFTAYNDKAEVIGYAVISQNFGYKSQVKQITGLTADGVSIATINVSQSDDAPYWRKLTKAFFDQFKNLDIKNISLEPKYDPNCFPCKEMYELFGNYNVDKASGATYSSNAVTMDVLDAFYTFDFIRNNK